MASIDHVEPDLAEKAALVALLQQPKARWSEVTAEIIELGSATRALEMRLNGEDTLFAVGDLEKDDRRCRARHHELGS
ncbi:MAG: hypothetical protein QOH50_4869 [Kribbellaceae bacterium]|jgi:DNA processing protein|nr:hypothetical protein [Kribbellaceae bacterium]